MQEKENTDVNAMGTCQYCRHFKLEASSLDGLCRHIILRGGSRVRVPTNEPITHLHVSRNFWCPFFSPPEVSDAVPHDWVTCKSGAFISGADLRAVRFYANYSVRELAKMVGVAAHKTLDNWENCKGEPNMEQLYQLLSACGIDIVRFLQIVLERSDHSIPITKAQLATCEL